MEGERRILLAFCLAIVCGVGVMSQGCAPDCTGMGVGTFVPDPLNCSQYYLCGADGLPIDHPIPCEPGNEFPPGASSCQPIVGEPCVAQCDKSHCRYACNSSLSTDVISSHSNCSQYYLCLPEGTFLRDCPPEAPVFDGTKCVSDKSKCCDQACTPYCSPGVVQVIDPENCTMFYVCLEVGPVDDKYHFSCEPGQHFDLQFSHCVSGAECTNLCEGGSIINPGSSTSAPGTPTTPGTGTTTTPGTGTTTPIVNTPSSTAGPTTIPECWPSWTCTSSGYFARCQTCTPDYFQCSGPGVQGNLQQCSGGLVFNTDPDYPYCVLEGNCPFHPNK